MDSEIINSLVANVVEYFVYLINWLIADVVEYVVYNNELINEFWWSRLCKSAWMHFFYKSGEHVHSTTFAINQLVILL